MAHLTECAQRKHRTIPFGLSAADIMLAQSSQSDSDETPKAHLTECAQRSHLAIPFGLSAPDIMLSQASQSNSDEAPTTHLTECAPRSHGRDLTKDLGKAASDLMLYPNDRSQGNIADVAPDEDAERISYGKQVQRS